MKKFKIVAAIFALTCILSLNNIKADSYLGFAGITLPAAQGTYVSSNATKTTLSNQYVKSYGAIDVLSGDDRGVGARLHNLGTSRVTLSVGNYVQLQNNGSLGQIQGDYQLEFRATRWTVTSATLSAMWILDDYLM